MTEQLCILEHRTDPERPRLAVEGLLICLGHGRRLTEQLAELPELRESLTEALARPWRENVSDDPTPLAISEKALPLQPDVADLRTEMEARLLSYARMVAEELDTAWPPTGVENVAPWLSDRLDVACRQEWIADMVEGVNELVRDARRFLDRAPARTYLYLGGCDDCHAALYVPADQADEDFSCKACGRVHDDARERREWVVGAMQDQLVTADEGAAFAAAYHQKPIRPKTVTSWARRGQIEKRGERGRAALYRLGDVVGQAWVSGLRAS